MSLFVDGDYTYADIDSNNVALYDYSSENSVLTVPEYFSGRYVSEIYAYAFEENTSITGLDFSQNGNRMKAINTKAFNESTGLGGDLILPSSLRTLGFAAFQGCVSLESLTVNYGVSEIPAQCFNRCSGLKSIILAPSVESIGNLAFAKCTSLESVHLPTSVNYISTSAFNGCYPTLYVYYDSYSYHFAVDNGFSYVLLDPENVPTEPATEAPTEAPTDAPTDAPTEAATEAAGWLLGDADGDGTVDTIDATMIQRYNALIPVDIPVTTLMHGDVDRDDDLTVIDSTFILRYNVQIPTPYPIGEWM